MNEYVKRVDDGERAEDVVNDIFEKLNTLLEAYKSEPASVVFPAEEIEAIVNLIEITDDDDAAPVVFINNSDDGAEIDGDYDDGALN